MFYKTYRTASGLRSLQGYSKWENAGKGIRQTGFVPSVYGLALVYGTAISHLVEGIQVKGNAFFFIVLMSTD